VNFFHGAFAPRFKNDNRSWHSLWKPAPFLLFCILFLGFRAANQNHVASRQQTSLGTIGQCERRGRGENYCHYTFPVGDEQYTGVNRATPELELGQTVVVYYDRQDPRLSALEDFSEQGRKNERFAYVLLLVLAAIVAFILWDGAPYRGTSDERTP